MSEEKQADNSAVGRARIFAKEKHSNHFRKFSGMPYYTHLEEVASLFALHRVGNLTGLAICYLHDTVEDTDTTFEELEDNFGLVIAEGVRDLTDTTTGQGNRVARKAKRLEELSKCTGVIQSIKLCDLISNATSIAMHDFKFATVYFKEMCDLVNALDHADIALRQMAMNIVFQFQNNYGRAS